MSGQHDYAKMYKQFKTENLELKQTIERQGQTIEELNRLAVDLKLRLGQHDNYNTPSSQQKGSKMYSTKKKEEEEKKKKSGTSSKIRKGQKGYVMSQTAKNRVEVKKATRARPANENLPSRRITCRIPVPNAVLTAFR